MKERIENLWTNFWYLFVGLGVLVYFLPGCTSGEDVKLGIEVAKDATAESGIEIITTATQGDWVGAGVAVGTAVLGAIGAYFTARKIRQVKNAKKTN